jgi:hypothetical protein
VDRYVKVISVKTYIQSSKVTQENWEGFTENASGGPCSHRVKGKYNEDMEPDT